MSTEDIEVAKDAFKFTGAEHALILLSGLNSLRNTNKFCDVILEVDGKKFPVHRNVLVAFSPYFEAMFHQNFAESTQEVVTIKDIEAEIMDLLLNYAYTGEIIITETNCQSLLAAADLLQIVAVRNAACEFLKKRLENDNCVGIYNFADSLNCEILRDNALNFMIKHFMSIPKGDWAVLPAETIINVIVSDNLHVKSEKNVLSAVMEWYNHKPEERKQEIHKVLSYVRLTSLGPYYLCDCPKLFPVIKENPECMTLIDEAKSFLLMPDRGPQLSNERTKSRVDCGIKQVLAVLTADLKGIINNILIYDTEEEIWYKLTSLPFSIRSKNAKILVLNRNTLYVCGNNIYADGKTAGAEITVNSLWKYNLEVNAWREMTPMPKPRVNYGLVSLNSCIYAVGGMCCNELEYLDEVIQYNPETDTWCYKKHLKKAVDSVTAVVHDNMIFVAGGYEEHDEINNYVQRYDSDADMWTEAMPMLKAKTNAAGVVFNDYIYTIGGIPSDSEEDLNYVERYDVKNNKWEEVASMNNSRRGADAVVLNNKIYVLGGSFTHQDESYIETKVLCYDPNSDKWEVVCELPRLINIYVSCVSLTVSKSYCMKLIKCSTKDSK